MGLQSVTTLFRCGVVCIGLCALGLWDLSRWYVIATVSMLLGFSAWAMSTMPVRGQISLVHSLGYQSIELVAGDTEALNPMQITDSEVWGVRRALEESGLELPSIACHGNLFAADVAERAHSLARVISGMELATRLAGPSGPPCVVTMGFGLPEQFEAHRQQIADNFAELARVGARLGVVVAVEPHVGQALDLPDRVQWVLDAVNSPYFRLNFDNSHFELMGCNFYDYVPQLTPYAVHTHMKDQRGIVPGFEFLVPGEGTFDYAAYLPAIENAGYRGSITVEISKMVQNRPGYDAAEVAARSYRVLTDAATRGGVTFAL